MKKQMMSRSWFVAGVLSAATFGAFANIPRTGSTSGTMAPTADVSEIRAKHHADLSFDQDLKRLSSIQGRYRENLPLMRTKATRPPKPLNAPRARAKVGQR